MYNYKIHKRKINSETVQFLKCYRPFYKEGDFLVFETTMDKNIYLNPTFISDIVEMEGTAEWHS